MATKIRLQRHGRKGQPFYHIVIADSRTKRDGKFIERLGFYNPTTIPATIELDSDKALDWLNKGAEPTDTVRAILRFRGILYRRHLLKGVEKGALTQEDADRKYEEWMSGKQAAIEQRKAKIKDDVQAKLKADREAGKAIAEAKVKARQEELTAADAEEPAEVEEAAEESVEAEVETTEAAPEAEEAVAEEAPVAEAEEPVAEEAAAEEPAAEEVAEEPAAEEAAEESAEEATSEEGEEEKA